MNPNTVWVMTEGIYSDYMILGVFDSPDAAKRAWPHSGAWHPAVRRWYPAPNYELHEELLPGEWRSDEPWDGHIAPWVVQTLGDG